MYIYCTLAVNKELQQIILEVLFGQIGRLCFTNGGNKLLPVWLYQMKNNKVFTR